MKQIAILSFITMAISLAFLFLINKPVASDEIVRDAMSRMEEGNYQEVVELLEGKETSLMLLGNAYYRLSKTEDGDEVQRKAFLEKSVDAYRMGVIKETQHVPLKYNYEFTLAQLESQEQQDQEDQQDQQQQGSEGQQDQEDQQDQQQQGSEGQQDQEDQQDQQQQGSEGQQDQEDQQDQQAVSESDGDTKPSDSEAVSATEDDAQLLQILDMLEQQEQESLKNNQEVLDQEQGDTYDW